MIRRLRWQCLAPRLDMGALLWDIVAEPAKIAKNRCNGKYLRHHRAECSVPIFDPASDPKHNCDGSASRRPSLGAKLVGKSKHNRSEALAESGAVCVYVIQGTFDDTGQ